MTTLKVLPQSNTSTLEEAIRTIYSPDIEMAINVLEAEECYDLKLELRLHLGKDLREVKGDCINGKA